MDTGTRNRARSGDLTWPIIAMADGDTQGPKKLQAQASKLAIGIDDIRQRTGELTRWGMP